MIVSFIDIENVDEEIFNSYSFFSNIDYENLCTKRILSHQIIRKRYNKRHNDKLKNIRIKRKLLNEYIDNNDITGYILTFLNKFF
jgi:hypothetical protein